MTTTELNSEPETVGVKDAAKIAGVHFTTIYAWIRSKRLRSTQPAGTGRPGAPHRIKLRDLRALLDGNDADITRYESPTPTKDL